MIYEFLIQDRVDEFLREAEKGRLIDKVKKPRKDRSQRLINTFLCRIGLVSKC